MSSGRRCPSLTEDRRKEFVKLVRDKAEQARWRSATSAARPRTTWMRTKDVGEDDIARAEKELESLTKSTIDAIDEALKRKEA